ncbi:MAG: hypothetical protein AAF399_22675 [Bacteroidota bacterium]
MKRFRMWLFAFGVCLLTMSACKCGGCDYQQAEICYDEGGEYDYESCRCSN